MGELGRLVDAYRGRQKYGATDSQIARALGVARQSVANWVRGDSMPSPTNLRALATHIETPYLTVLDAALADAGYLTREAHHDDAAAITHAGGSPASDTPGATLVPSGEPQRSPAAAADRAPRRGPKVGAPAERRRRTTGKQPPGSNG